MSSSVVSVSEKLFKEVGNLSGIKAEAERDVALKTLKRIKRKSDVKAFFSKPVVVIAMGVALILTSMVIFEIFQVFWITSFCATVILSTALLVTFFAGLKMINCGISDFIRGEAPKLKYFKKLSRDAKEAIEKINGLEKSERIQFKSESDNFSK